MSTMSQFVCWKENAVLAVTPRDAANLKDGHFQAIHHPLRLRRRKLGGARSGGPWVEEADIVSSLNGKLRPDGYLFLPIVGGSGTGKSHLVRWVRDQTAGTPDWESRYLPKNRTGLRRAIEIIIRDLEGPKIAEAREALAAAPAQTERDEILAERLLDELALLVSRPDEFLPSPSSTDPQADQTRAKLARQLPDVLRDPVVRRKLLEPGAVVLRLVGLALRGRQEGDGLDDDATRFQVADLPLTFQEIGETSQGARNLLRQLASVGSLLSGSVDLINEALPIAEKRITVSHSVDVVEVFRELRRELHARGKELALFIEDLTVLHGVEKEFLDAIVEPVQSDEGRMCNLRMIFAVTEGHFDDLDTIRTRCDDAYWLDTVYGSDGVDSEEGRSFLGRYLNASRLEPADLQPDWEQRDGGQWLKNACDTCEYRGECHDTFGVSPEGYGLYPYNAPTLDRLIPAVSPDRFDPRDVVRELVNRFLLQGGPELERAAFPSSDLLAPFDASTEPLPPLLIAEIKNRRPTDHDRLANTLRYWSDATAFTQIDPRVPEIFGLANVALDLDALRTVSPARAQPGRRTPEVEPTPAPGGPEAMLSSASRTHFDALRAWAGQGRDLSAATTRALRRLIHRSVQNNLEYGPVAVNLGAIFDERRFGESAVGLVGSVTQQRLDVVTILVERTDAMAAALQGLILLSELGEAGFPQAERYRRLVADAIEDWTTKLVESLSAPASPDTVAAVEALIVAAAVTGRAQDARTAADFVGALFESAHASGDMTNRSDNWRAIHTQAEAIIGRLRPIVEAEFGEARGTRGGVRALETSRLLPIVEKFISQWELSASDAAIAAFYRGIRPAIDEEWRTLGQRATEAKTIVDQQRPWSEQTEKVLQVIRAAHNAGRLDDANALDALTNYATNVSDTAHRAVFAAADQVGPTATLPQQLVVLSGIVPADVFLVSRFATRANTALNQIERSLLERQASEGRSDMETVTERVLEVTTRFADAVKSLS
jgi:hypothetical protein